MPRLYSIMFLCGLWKSVYCTHYVVSQLQSTSAIINELQVFPLSIQNTIMEYVFNKKGFSKFSLDQRFTTMKKHSLWTVNDHGDIIISTSASIITWNPATKKYKVYPLDRDVYIDRIEGGRVVLAQRYKEKKNYILTILSGKLLADTITYSFPGNYLENIVEISEDGSSICYAKNPLIDNRAIREIYWTSLRGGAVNKLTINKDGCMPPLIMSHDGSYVGAVDPRTLEVIVMKTHGNFGGNEDHTIVRLPTIPSSGPQVLRTHIISTKGLNHKELYWVEMNPSNIKKNAPVVMKKSLLQSISYDRTWMHESGERFMGAHIATEQNKVHVQILTTKTEIDQQNGSKAYSLVVDDFSNVMQQKGICKPSNNVLLSLGSKYQGVKVIHNTHDNVLYTIPSSPLSSKCFMYDGFSCFFLHLLSSLKENLCCLSPNGHIAVIGDQYIIFDNHLQIKKSRKRSSVLTLPQSLVDYLNKKQQKIDICKKFKELLS